MLKNTQACVASVQTSSKDINQISEDTLAPIQLQVTRTNDPMVIIRAKGSTQQPSRNILLRAAVYDTVWKRTVLPLQDMKIETMMIHHQKKVKLANKDANTRINPNSTSGIYLTSDKVAQCRQVAENRIEMDEAKKITAKKTATRKILQKYVLEEQEGSWQYKLRTLEEQEAFNGLLNFYIGHTENEWLAVSKIKLVGSKI